MLTGVDRILVVSRDRRRAIAAWRRLLGAELVREDAVPALGANRSVLRVGSSEVEVLEMAGIGAVANHLARSRPGVFALGVTALDPKAVQRRLDALGIHHLVVGEQIFVHHDWLDVPGLHLVVSPAAEREPAGLLTHLYEVTHLCHDFTAAAARLARVFELESRHFVPIRSERYGYEGRLTLFDPDRLDRVETVTPFDPGRTMGRFFARRGPCLYMAYGESDRSAEIRGRLNEHAPRDWTGPAEGEAADNLFLHPRALDGVLIGVSRTSFAWTWSGRPERVRPAAGAAA